MKALRILLQLAILGAGGIALAALITRPAPDVTSIPVFLGFLAFLLALTLALKEHTEKRLLPGHKLSFKPMGIVLLLLGAFGIFYGASYLIGSQPLPNGSGGTCRAVCGLILLASQSLGETVARFFAFGLWTSIGLFLCFVGYKVRGVKAT
ncbi:MAG: hypothetical protein ACT4P9_10720 [Betaproteobacteria bacterium]